MIGHGKPTKRSLVSIGSSKASDLESLPDQKPSLAEWVSSANYKKRHGPSCAVCSLAASEVREVLAEIKAQGAANITQQQVHDYLCENVKGYSSSVSLWTLKRHLVEHEPTSRWHRSRKVSS